MSTEFFLLLQNMLIGGISTEYANVDTKSIFLYRKVVIINKARQGKFNKESLINYTANA